MPVYGGECPEEFLSPEEREVLAEHRLAQDDAERVSGNKYAGQPYMQDYVTIADVCHAEESTLPLPRVTATPADPR
jgi:hypothetical protein